jgi:hypothetical protein
LPYMGNIRSRKYILGAGEIMGHWYQLGNIGTLKGCTEERRSFPFWAPCREQPCVRTFLSAVNCLSFFSHEHVTHNSRRQG